MGGGGAGGGGMWETPFIRRAEITARKGGVGVRTVVVEGDMGNFIHQESRDKIKRG